MDRARVLTTKMNNDRAHGHCLSFAWIERSWTFGDAYFSFQTRFYHEPITWSLHLPYILEPTFARIFLFLEQFSPKASLNFQESILYSALYCVGLCCAVLYCIILYCIAYSKRKSKSPAVSKNRKIHTKVVS